MSENPTRAQPNSWSGLKLLLLVAFAFAALLCALVFTLDFGGRVDQSKAKAEGKAAVKKGESFASGVSFTSTQSERAVGAIIGAVIVLTCVGGIPTFARRRRIPRHTKIWIVVAGLFTGLVLVVPLRAGLMGLSKLLL